MNNQVLLLSVVVLSVSVAFLFFQNMKLSKKVEQQYKLVNGHINDLSQTIALNNRINIKLKVFELNFIYLAFLNLISLLISIIKPPI